MRQSGTLVSLTLALLLMFQLNSSFALPIPPEGCRWDSEGSLDCGEVIVVTGESDSFGCRKNPANCIPVYPPHIPAGTNDPATSGHDYTTAVDRFADALSKSNCKQLAEQKTLYEGYVEADRHFIASSEANVAEYDRMINSNDYSEGTLDLLQSTADLVCATYGITKAARLEGMTCREIARGQGEKCTVAPPSTQELQQQLACTQATREAQARQAGLVQWQSRKSGAVAEVRKWKKNLVNDLKRLEMIKKAMTDKKCPR